MARIVIENLVKRFGKVIAVNNVSFEVKDGELIVLLGPSGCGKTTTLRCIAGLETPDSGNISIGDILVNDLPPKDRKVSMVFQSYALFPQMTVYRNIAFPLKIRKFPKSEIDTKVKEVADLLKISHLLDRKPSQISGGECQRTALGRAIIYEPKAFLLDEPLSNLDAKLRVYMRAELKKLQRRLNVTTVYVTHDQVEAMTLADRIVVMNEGNVMQLDTPDVIYSYPSNLFVAGFMGSPPMNFFDCTYTEKDGSFILDAERFNIEIRSDLAEAIGKSGVDELIFGVRPEDIKVLTESRTGCIESKVDVIEPLGSELILDLNIKGASLQVKTSADTKVRVGDSVWIFPDLSKSHIFNKKTGDLII